MSGILDTKSRVMDTIITLEGRRQIASSKLIVEYLTFTDSSTYYKADIDEGVADATKRIYLESCHLPQDQITFEADDSGRLSPFKNSSNVQIKDGKFLINILSGSIRQETILSGSAFSSTSDSILASSIENFNKLRIIGTKDLFYEDNEFLISNKNIEFLIKNDKPISDKGLWEKNLTSLDSLFSDIRLSRVENFKYLPPINKLSNASIDKSDYRNNKDNLIGNYAPFSTYTHLEGLTIQDIEKELKIVNDLGYGKNINFDLTSKNNSLIAQFFELSDNNMSKLEVIDFGKHQINGNTKQVFFIGKILIDDNETQTYLHLFTLVFG